MARADDTILAADFANVPARLDGRGPGRGADAALVTLAATGQVHDPTLASVEARLNMAVQLDRRGDRAAAIELLETVIADRPARPHGATGRAQALMRSIKLKAES